MTKQHVTDIFEKRANLEGSRDLDCDQCGFGSALPDNIIKEMMPPDSSGDNAV
ncbi:hypothetical protein [Celeribacter sp.]|uniref:hypothetical protein n=1 Tax=Celeribacter sp. TaxID=1890673 RepID=UPI003A8F2070